jgi:hypothetical protein
MLHAKIHLSSCADRALLHHRSIALAESLYETLGVAQDASERDIKKAYRQKALKLHPDVNKAVSSSRKSSSSSSDQQP